MRVLVVGAGVVGLSCAVRLLEAGHRVDVLARDLPRESTSAVAAAIWYPYRAEPRDRVGAWGSRTYAVLAGLADEGVPGVVVRRTTEVVADTDAEDAVAVRVARTPRLMTLATVAAVAGGLSITVVAGPLYGLAERAAEDLVDPRAYTGAVLVSQDER